MPGSRAKVRWIVVGTAVILVSLLEVKQFVEANQAPPAAVKEIKLGYGQARNDVCPDRGSKGSSARTR